MNYSPNNYLYDIISYLDANIVGLGTLIIIAAGALILSGMFHAFKYSIR
jgi:hypothetical protein